MTKKSPTAAVLLIGDELLSGRTRDINLQQIASYLAPLGIPVRETRIVPDVEDEIVEAVNSLRAKYTYVFTTGGIGPTHDDITTDAVAAVAVAATIAAVAVTVAADVVAVVTIVAASARKKTTASSRSWFTSTASRRR